MEGNFTHIIQQLVLDDAFIKHVLDNQLNRDEYLKKYGSDGLNDQALDKAIEAVKAFKQSTKEEISDSKTAQLWDKIELKTTNKNTDLRITKNHWWKPLSIAASIALLLGMFWLLQGNSSLTEVDTSIAERITVDLLDGSKVKLSAETELSWNEDNYLSNRRIEMQGEAFFEVEKGEKFTVESPLGSVEVLGTSFNVYSRNNTFRVACRTGKVRVTLKDGYSEILTPGKQIELIDGKHISRTINQEELWIYGHKYLKDIQLSSLVEEVERQFDVKILLDKEVSEKMGNFVINLSELDSTLQHIAWPLNGHFVEKEKNVYQFEKNQ